MYAVRELNSNVLLVSFQTMEELERYLERHKLDGRAIFITSSEPKDVIWKVGSPAALDQHYFGDL